jgi:hypothetical protein
MSKALVFNTATGIPVKLDAESNEPTFYLRPNDTDFIERLTRLYDATKDYDKKAQEKRSKLEIKLDENDVPGNINQYLEIMKEDFDFIMGQIDELLGDGVSKAVFQGRRDEELLDRFMSFISDQITENRKSTISKYSKKSNKGVMR